MKLNEPNTRPAPSPVLPGAEPLFLIGSKIGFLFIHGFTGAPYEGREIARRLHTELGFTVSVPLLPGHGTRPQDLLPVHWTDWYRAVREHYFTLKQQCERVFVCGQSMGGALVLHLASHHPVDGVISLAGAVFLKDWRLYLLPLARHILTYQHKSRGPDIRNKALKSQVPSYHKYPVKSVDQLLELLHHVRADLMEVTAPALLIHSRKDRTVTYQNLDYIYQHIASTQKQKVTLENSYHVISIDVEKETVYQEIKQFILDQIASSSPEITKNS